MSDDLESKVVYDIVLNVVEKNTLPEKPAPTESEVTIIAVSHGRLSIDQFHSARVAAQQNGDLVRFHGPDGRPRLAIAKRDYIRQIHEWLSQHDQDTTDAHATLNGATEEAGA